MAVDKKLLYEIGNKSLDIPKINKMIVDGKWTLSSYFYGASKYGVFESLGIPKKVLLSLLRDSSHLNDIEVNKGTTIFHVLAQRGKLDSVMSNLLYHAEAILKRERPNTKIGKENFKFTEKELNLASKILKLTEKKPEFVTKVLKQVIDHHIFKTPVKDKVNVEGIKLFIEKEEGKKLVAKVSMQIVVNHIFKADAQGNSPVKYAVDSQGIEVLNKLAKVNYILKYVAEYCSKSGDKLIDDCKSKDQKLKVLKTLMKLSPKHTVDYLIKSGKLDDMVEDKESNNSSDSKELKILQILMELNPERTMDYCVKFNKIDDLINYYITESSLTDLSEQVKDSKAYHNFVNCVIKVARKNHSDKKLDKTSKEKSDAEFYKVFELCYFDIMVHDKNPETYSILTKLRFFAHGNAELLDGSFDQQQKVILAECAKLSISNSKFELDPKDCFKWFKPKEGNKKGLKDSFKKSFGLKDEDLGEKKPEVKEDKLIGVKREEKKKVNGLNNEEVKIEKSKEEINTNKNLDQESSKNIEKNKINGVKKDENQEKNTDKNLVDSNGGLNKKVEPNGFDEETNKEFTKTNGHSVVKKQKTTAELQVEAVYEYIEKKLSEKVKKDLGSSQYTKLAAMVSISTKYYEQFESKIVILALQDKIKKSKRGDATLKNYPDFYKFELQKFIEAVVLECSEQNLSYLIPKYNITIFDLACIRGHKSWFEVLFDAGIKFGIYNDESASVYHASLKYGCNESLKYLLSEQKKINIPWPEVVRDSIKYGNDKGIKYYLESGFEVIKEVTDIAKRKNMSGKLKYTVLNYGLDRLCDAAELRDYKRLKEKDRQSKEKKAINLVLKMAKCLQLLADNKKLHYGVDSVDVLKKTINLLKGFSKYIDLFVGLAEENHKEKVTIEKVVKVFKKLQESLIEDYKSILENKDELKAYYEAFEKLENGEDDNISIADTVFTTKSFKSTATQIHNNEVDVVGKTEINNGNDNIE